MTPAGKRWLYAGGALLAMLALLIVAVKMVNHYVASQLGDG
jgi:hypothetical protein